MLPVLHEEATFDSDGTTGSASTKFQSIHLTYRIAKWCLLYLWCKHYLWCLLYTHNGTEFHLICYLEALCSSFFSSEFGLCRSKRKSRRGASLRLGAVLAAAAPSPRSSYITHKGRPPARPRVRELLYEGPVGDVVVLWQLVCAPLFPGRPPGTEGGGKELGGEGRRAY